MPKGKKGKKEEEVQNEDLNQINEEQRLKRDTNVEPSE